MLLASTLLAIFSFQHILPIANTALESQMGGLPLVTISMDRRSNSMMTAARTRVNMLRNNELVTEDPLDNAILYKKLKAVMAAYVSGKISDNVFMILIAEFETISHTGRISHQMADEWLKEVKLYVK